jgi:Lar family restriction alleviation protein
LRKEKPMTNGEKFKTAEERSRAYQKYCSSNGMECNKCPLRKVSSVVRCSFEWLNLEYKEELKPCPFCGGEAMERKSNKLYYVFCKNCSVKTVDSITKDAAIEAWNRRVS